MWDWPHILPAHVAYTMRTHITAHCPRPIDSFSLFSSLKSNTIRLQLTSALRLRVNCRSLQKWFDYYNVLIDCIQRRLLPLPKWLPDLEFQHKANIPIDYLLTKTAKPTAA